MGPTCSMDIYVEPSLGTGNSPTSGVDSIEMTLGSGLTDLFTLAPSGPQIGVVNFAIGTTSLNPASIMVADLTGMLQQRNLSGDATMDEAGVVTVTGFLPDVPENANFVLAGPTSGGAANPTFRALVEADLIHAYTSQMLFSGGAVVGTVLRTLNGMSAYNGIGITFVNAANTHGVTLQSDSTSNNDYTIQFPSSAPASNTYLKYNGTDYVWATVSGLSSSLTSAHIFVGNGSNVATDVAVSGDLTLANTGAFTIANSAVTYAKIQNVTTARLMGRATAGSGVMEEITLGTGLSYSGTTLNVSGFASNTLTSAHIYVGNASNVATDVTVSGDLTLANTGAFTIANNAVTYAKFQQVAAVSLVGNPTGSLANASGITLGTGLSFSGTTLISTVTGLPTGTDKQMLVNVSGTWTATSNMTYDSTNHLLNLNNTAATGTNHAYIFRAFAGAGTTAAIGLITNGVSTFLGNAAGNLTCVNENDGFGANALVALTSGTYNVSMGINSSVALQTGNSNVAIGRAAMFSNVSSAFNVAVGYQSMALGTGASNTLVGAHSANSAISSGTGNVTLGRETGYGAGTSVIGTGSYNVLLGAFASVLTTNDSNKLVIHGASAFSATPLIYGDFSAKTLLFNAYAATTQSFIQGYTTTATAAGTTTLVVSSPYQQFFTGSTTQTITLPVASTMAFLGQGFLITNRSTGNLTVNSSGANLVQTIQPGQQCLITCILLSGTSAASWDSYITISGTIPASYGGTGFSTAAVGDLPYYATTTPTMGKLPIGSTGQNLVVRSGLPSWEGLTLVSKSAAYTFALGDEMKGFELTGSSPFSFTVDTNANVAFAIGTIITVMQTGTGALTIAAAGGVTINSASGLIMNAQYSCATLWKVATNTWVLSGSTKVS